jgi:DNA polymerase I-like protein with 3'-5' exonuclease and polymerase domains
LNITNYREAANTPTQGSAADGAKLALVYMDHDRHSMPEARVIGFIHDEFVIEAPIDKAQEAAAWAVKHCEDAMRKIVSGKVPIKAKAIIAKDWAGTPL